MSPLYEGVRGQANGSEMTAPFLLFDDARPGGRARLYAGPVGEIRADRLEEVIPALEQVQAAVRRGQHVAGYLAYEAGYALDQIGRAHV